VTCEQVIQAMKSSGKMEDDHYRKCYYHFGFGHQIFIGPLASNNAYKWQQRILLFTQTILLISKVNDQNTLTHVNSHELTHAS